MSYNQSFLKIWRIAAAAVAGKSAAEVAARTAEKTSDPKAYRSRLEELLTTNTHTVSHDIIALKDGRTLDRYAAPAFAKNGACVGRVFFNRDITEQRRVELSLRKVNRVLMVLAALLFVAFSAAIIWPYLSRSEPANWQTWNRAVNQSTSLANRVLSWSAEGKDGYDCKGFVVLKARELLLQGVTAGRMRALIVAEGDHEPAHMVLQVDNQVFDDMSPWPGKPADYRVLTALPILDLIATAAQSGFS